MTIPTNKPGVPEEIVAVRRAIADAQAARGQLLFRIECDKRLLTATELLLRAIEDAVHWATKVPYSLNLPRTSDERPEERHGTLAPEVWQHREQLEPLANTYGYTIKEHCELKTHGCLCEMMNYMFDLDGNI